ncbi:replicative DNA helicase [Vineibacter terrae]|uniref:Replicative DNA helicase n=1 Tax=Vineibacter terrae TaxID=2586908 RepID=A0A5C8PVT1_9HYPH|nr:replicative DNA helicase [Vineibacter terrae]TXL82296.1 replicative DNA helicase [Vineibacter terrae]
MDSVYPSGQPAPDNDPHLREPPHNFQVEQALLGAILVNNLAYNRISDFLKPEHFADPLHGRIFDTAARMIERNQVVDYKTLRTFFETDETLVAAGRQNYLADLAAAAISIIDAGDYGRQIHDLFLRRQLIDVGETMVNDAFARDIETPATMQIEMTEKKLYELASAGQIEGGFRPFKMAITEAVEQAESAYKRVSGLTGVATGLHALDHLMGGLHRSDLIILAGRPSMGKTALATNMAFHAARSYREEFDESQQAKVADGAVVGFFSLEMSAEQLATRILAERAEVSSEKIRRGEMNARDFDQVLACSRELEMMPLFIDDTPGLTVQALRTRARRLKRQHGLGLLVIDYLQLLQGASRGREANRVQEISEITRGLKMLAKELDVPVIALSQLSRAVEQREDKRPQLADLRESGSIEQDADVVMFVYREEYYLTRAEPARRPDESDERFNERHDQWKQRCEQAYGKAEAIVAKQRHGPTGIVRLRFEGAITKFDNLPADDSYVQDQY